MLHFQIGNSNTLGNNNTRRTTGAPLSMVLSNEHEIPASYIMETRTLPRQPRPNYALNHANASQCQTPTMVNPAVLSTSSGFTIQHQRTASANAAMQHLTNSNSLAAMSHLQLPPKNEHKLQYFDLDVTNAPAINRQSVGNLSNASVSSRLASDPSARAPVQSTVVYNSVDFVKTEAFKRIREERKTQNEGVNVNK